MLPQKYLSSQKLLLLIFNDFFERDDIQNTLLRLRV
jgi:hypothetical protein